MEHFWTGMLMTDLRKFPLLSLYSGEYDFSTKAKSELMVNSLGTESLWFGEQTSHIPMYEDQPRFMKVIQNSIGRSCTI